MDRYVVQLDTLDQSQGAIAGGKAVNLGELSRLNGIAVPRGVCVTTHAFRRMLALAPSIDRQVDQLSRLRSDDRDAIRTVAAELRTTIESVDIPADITREITGALDALGPARAYAVRSSATAEDLPTASFAGQQDTYLNVTGSASILAHTAKCWASLFTERAVMYRRHNRIDHRAVSMAVIVQHMVHAQASGVLFTADPMSGNRTHAVVEAIRGLGEALVTGTMNADSFTVRDNSIIARSIASTSQPMPAPSDGSTHATAIDGPPRTLAALTDEQVLQLVQYGRRIEAHFGRPQDIEWCLADGEFHFVQSRPITTLFPIPVVTDTDNHVWLSVGHAQMMTDAMKPLGISMRQLLNPMAEAGGRLFYDVTRQLSSPVARAGLFAMAGKSDPLVGDALQSILDRGDFIRERADDDRAAPPPSPQPAPPIANDPAIVAALIEQDQRSTATLRHHIAGKTGQELLSFIVDDIQEMKRILFDPLSHQAILAGIEASWWLNERLQAWLGETNVADTLTLSAPGNVTSEMGLALMDVADLIRPHLQVVHFLRHDATDDFLAVLPTIHGGRESRDAIMAWLDTYGMRCAGEIDITRPRWSERPSMLIPMLLGNIQQFEPGAAARRFAQGQRLAAEKEHDVLERLRALPDGTAKADETKRMIDRVRTFIGYREYPKYGMVNRMWVHKQALMQEADRLVQAGVIHEREDIFYLTIDEIQDVVRTQRADERLIARRREEFLVHQALIPPRVLTSEGEALDGRYRNRDAPHGALIGLAVSVGVVEGRARVVFDSTTAVLEAGDILVTRFTDPSWTPLFVAIAGVITEVGGLMTHGAVIAREYGLPAVVGVQHATRRIRDGQRIRVDGTNGFVEPLD